MTRNILIAALFFVGQMTALVPTVFAGSGNNYPDQWKFGGLGQYIDDWGYFTRYCTSWTAWALHDRNGFEIPRAIGNASNWGYWAENNGYEVNMTPGVGSVAWWASSHVAWVKSVNPNDTVTIEEYNYGYTGNYHVRDIPKDDVSGYIHFKDITNSVSDGYGGVARDFNGAGGDDILWYNPGPGVDPVWHSKTSSRKAPFNTDNTVSVKGEEYSPLKGDFNGDGYADVFWYGPGDIYDSVWYGTQTKGSFDMTNLNANVKGDYMPLVGDFNGDNHDDILWYGPGGANDAIWYGVDSKVSKFNKSFDVIVKGIYKPAVGDFDGDGSADILWYGPSGANDSMWYGTQTTGVFSKGYKVTVRGDYEPVVGDFSGNDQDDILWYGPGTANDAIWYGSSSRDAKFNKNYDVVVNGTKAQPVVGDYDNDRYDDILWYRQGDTVDEVWYGNKAKEAFSEKQQIIINWNYIPV